MRKLLSANFARLWRSNFFWLTAGILCCWGGIVYFLMVLNTEKHGISDIAWNTYFFNGNLCLGPALAVFTAFFIGSEYSDGGFRNKIAVGHKRLPIYLSNLITCAGAGIVNCSKLTEQELRKALAKLLEQMKTARHTKKLPQGKMTVKQLAAQNKGMQSTEVSSQTLGSFNRIARKYGIDYALLAASQDYDSQLNIGADGIMGYVEIPKINVNLPIYHGTGNDSLDRGVGHLLGSSLPVGGEDTQFYSQRLRSGG